MAFAVDTYADTSRRVDLLDIITDIQDTSWNTYEQTYLEKIDASNLKKLLETRYG